MAIERTFAIVKPDAVKDGHIGEILTAIEQGGLKINALKMVRLTPAICKGFYHEHVTKGFYPELEDFMTEGPVVIMTLEGENAIATWPMPPKAPFASASAPTSAATPPMVPTPLPAPPSKWATSSMPSTRCNFLLRKKCIAAFGRLFYWNSPPPSRGGFEWFWAASTAEIARSSSIIEAASASPDTLMALWKAWARSFQAGTHP